jgi:hypothetical protein
MRDEFRAIVSDPELNAKCRKTRELMQEHGLTPVHAVFAVALSAKQLELGCPCGDPETHRRIALQDVIDAFEMAYDAAVPSQPAS